MAYIDRELFKKDIKKRYCNNCVNPNEIKCRCCNVDDLLGEIEDAPTADVAEVVRCKDCKFRKTGDCAMYYECDCGSQYSWENNNDFCSYGQRK